MVKQHYPRSIFGWVTIATQQDYSLNNNRLVLLLLDRRQSICSSQNIIMTPVLPRGIVVLSNIIGNRLTRFSTLTENCEMSHIHKSFLILEQRNLNEGLNQRGSYSSDKDYTSLSSLLAHFDEGQLARRYRSRVRNATTRRIYSLERKTLK